MWEDTTMAYFNPLLWPFCRETAEIHVKIDEGIGSRQVVEMCCLQWNILALPGRSTNVQALTGRYASVLDCAFNALGLLVLQTPTDERRSTRLVGPNRHVLVWLTIMFLLITTSYGSGLASILTLPRYIDTTKASLSVPRMKLEPRCSWLVLYAVVNHRYSSH
jgi:hypothetical protein